MGPDHSQLEIYEESKHGVLFAAQRDQMNLRADPKRLTTADMVVTNLDAHVVEGDLRPSSDVDTHVELYKAFTGVGGIVHTHSTVATAWAQAGREIPCFGTTHADYYHGPVPVTAPRILEDLVALERT